MAAKSVADLLAEYPDNTTGEITAAAGRDVINSNLNLVDGGTLQAALNSDHNFNTSADINCSGAITAGVVITPEISTIGSSITISGNVNVTGSLGMSTNPITDITAAYFVDANPPFATLSLGTPALASNRSVTFQDSDGVIALISDLPDVSVYLPLSGGNMTGNIDLQHHSFLNVAELQFQTLGGETASISAGTLTANRLINIPDANGTLALASDFLPLAGGTMTGDINMGTGVYKVDGVQVVTSQQAAVPDVSGGVVVDDECRAALNDLLAKLRTHGLINNGA